MGWIVVEFSDRREVFVGGNSHGSNCTETGQLRALQVGDGLQTIWLGGDPNFEPASQRVDVPATSDPIRPFRVVFTKKLP
jgi:hypothetical protein